MGVEEEEPRHKKEKRKEERENGASWVMCPLINKKGMHMTFPPSLPGLLSSSFLPSLPPSRGPSLPSRGPSLSRLRFVKGEGKKEREERERHHPPPLLLDCCCC